MLHQQSRFPLPPLIRPRRPKTTPNSISFHWCPSSSRKTWSRRAKMVCPIVSPHLSSFSNPATFGWSGWWESCPTMPLIPWHQWTGRGNRRCDPTTCRRPWMWKWCATQDVASTFTCSSDRPRVGGGKEGFILVCLHARTCTCTYRTDERATYIFLFSFCQSVSASKHSRVTLCDFVLTLLYVCLCAPCDPVKRRYFITAYDYFRHSLVSLRCGLRVFVENVYAVVETKTVSL